MKKLVLLCFILSNCSSIPQDIDCRARCNTVIKAEEERYQVCQSHINECMEVLKKSNPPLLSKVVWGVLGIGIGLVVGTKLNK